MTAIIARKARILDVGNSKAIVIPSTAPLSKSGTATIASLGRYVLVDVSGTSAEEELLGALQGIAGDSTNRDRRGDAEPHLATIGTKGADGKWKAAPEGSGTYAYTG